MHSGENEDAASRFRRLQEKNKQLQPAAPGCRKPKVKGAAKGKRIEDVDLSIDRIQATWAWPGRLPKASILLTAREGSGKSSLVNWLAWHFSTGTDWPDGQPCEAGSVLLFDSEDGSDRKLLVLEGMGADMSRIEVADVQHLDDSGMTLAEFVVKYHEEHPDLRMVSADVCRDFDRRLRSAEDKSMEDALAEIKQIALERSLAVVLVHHEGKGSEEKQARDRARGSTHWTAHARVHWSLMTNSSYGPNAVSVEVGKANWARSEDKTAMIFRFESGVAQGDLTYGKLVFDQFVALGEFQKPAAEAPAARGRKRAVEPEAVSRAILETLLAAGGQMAGRMPDELKAETIQGSDTWRSFAANLVSEKTGMSAYNVCKHFREHLKGKEFAGYHFSLLSSPGPGGKYYWLASKLPEKGVIES